MDETVDEMTDETVDEMMDETMDEKKNEEPPYRHLRAHLEAVTGPLQGRFFFIFFIFKFYVHMQALGLMTDSTSTILQYSFGRKMVALGYTFSRLFSRLTHKPPFSL